MRARVKDKEREKGVVNGRKGEEAEGKGKKLTAI